MAKFAMLAAMLVALVAVQAFPADRDNDISAAAAHGDWDLVHKLIKEQFNDQHIWEPSFTSGSVRSLKPIPGGKVFGTSEYSFHTSSNVNGEKNEKSGGHRVINDNGNVKEYDFVPTF